MRMVLVPILASGAIVTGCMHLAYPPQLRNFDRGLEAIGQRDFSAGYRFLEQPSPGTDQQVIRLMQEHPQLVEAGATTFTTNALAESISHYGRAESFRIEHARLQRFAVYAAPGAFRIAADAVTQMYPQELAAHYAKQAEIARVAQLPDAEQQQYWADQFKRGVEAATVRGVIISTQLVDQSRPGTAHGSRLGAFVGQAAYIDSSSWRNYRASSQLAAGLLGAALGSFLDQRPTQMYLKVYFVRTASGDIRRIDEQASDPVLLPPGACLEYREPFHLAVTADKLCSP